MAKTGIKKIVKSSPPKKAIKPVVGKPSVRPQSGERPPKGKNP